MEVLAAQRVDPGTIALAGILYASRMCFDSDGVRLGAMTADPSQRSAWLWMVPVERRDHLCSRPSRPAARPLRIVVELSPDLPREVRRAQRERHSRRRARPVRRGRSSDAAGDRVVQRERREVVEDLVAANHRRGIRRDDEPALGVGLGVAVRIERRGRLRQAGEQRSLGRGQVPKVLDAEIDLGRCRDAVGVMAVEDLVEVGGDDLFLPGLAGELRRSGAPTGSPPSPCGRSGWHRQRSRCPAAAGLERAAG